jgi:fluoroacetyl-CoA thioesterase
VIPADLPIGTSITHEWIVESGVTVAAHGAVDLPVLATPHLIFMLEDTCVFATQPHLDEGHLTVGTEVHVFHLGAAKTGERIETYAELTAVRGRRLAFRVEARCRDTVIARGTHERAVVNAAEFIRKLNV